MRVVITGAAGRIGTQLIDELSASHELRLLDRRAVRDRRIGLADFSQVAPDSGLRRQLRSKRAQWNETFEHADVVVHLAAEINPGAPWEKVLPDNIQGTWNVIDAAARCGVRRVVFASSNWAVKGLERRLAPDCYRPDGAKIGSEASPCPRTPYGLSKAFGESTGRMFVDEGRLHSFVAVRIGAYLPEPPKDKDLLTRWIGPIDIRKLFRRCIEAEFAGFHVVYGVSAQTTSPYNLSHTVQLLSWQPVQTPA
jgi:nucleoside-diphosphate-sugar epimerase